MTMNLLFDEKFLKVATDLFKAAKREVFVIVYLMTVPSERKPGKESKLYEELLEAKRRGLDCRIILNYTVPVDKASRQNMAAGRWLSHYGIKCRIIARNRTVHAKMIIVDGVTLIMGSHNWSRRAIDRNVEASVKISDMGVVKRARENFMELWSDAVDLKGKGEN